MTKETKVKYPVKHLKIITCGNLYHRWKTEKPLYEKAPKNGLTMDVEYADTKRDCEAGSDRQKVMLCLHGAPGSHSDFAAIIDHMTALGVRVIAPNFPGIHPSITQLFQRKTSIIRVITLSLLNEELMNFHSLQSFATNLIQKASIS